MIVALIGAPGSGKSEIADRLGIRMSFADPLRDELAGLLAPALSVIDNYYSSPSDIKRFMTDPRYKDAFRTLLQRYGTDFRRAQDPDYWVNLFAGRLDRTLAEGHGQWIVVDDCRMPNEYALLRKYGATVIRLESGPNTRPMLLSQSLHESEAYWPSFPVDLIVPYVEGIDCQVERIQNWLVEQTNSIAAPNEV